MKRTAETANTTLLLAAHGSSRSDGVNPVRRLSDQIRTRNLFTEVHCGFLKQTPKLSHVLTQILTPRLTVVPMLSGHGYITDALIPEALKSLDRSIDVKLCPPVGVSESIPGIMADRALFIIKENDLDHDQVSILLAAHGNAKNPQNAKRAHALASDICDRLGTIEASAAFIEESPYISDWPQTTTRTNLIVLPFLIGGGLHGAEDVPEMLGLNAKDPALTELGNAPCLGPLDAQGRKIWLCQPLGQEPALIDTVLKLATQK